MDAEKHLKLLGLSRLLAVGHGASRNREVESIKLVLVAVNLDV